MESNVKVLKYYFTSWYYFVMRRMLIVAIACLAFLLRSVDFVFATDASSANYSNFDSTFAPGANVNQASTNYKMDASVEWIVGNQSSANFSIPPGGVPFPDPSAPAPAPAPAPGGGGGGGGGGGAITPTPTTSTPSGVTVPPPTLEVKTPTWKNHQVIGGKRDVTAAAIWVNGSKDGVKFIDPLRWKKDMPLFLGYNDLYVQAETAVGNKSVVINGQIHRLLIGDVDTSRRVDDVDISLFSRAWRKYTFFADFNEDTLVDDVDLSLLASHWLNYY